MNSSKLKTSSILVIGDIMLDTWITLDERGKSRETSSVVYDKTSEFNELGGAANAARICKFLTQGRVVLYGIVGNDCSASILDSRCKELGIENYFLSDNSRQTTSKKRLAFSEDFQIRIDNEKRQDISNFYAEQILNEIESKQFAFDVILLSDYGKGTLTPFLISSIINRSRVLNIPIIADPSLKRVQDFAGSQVIKANNFEWESLVSLATKPKIDSWNTELNCPLIVITEREKGMSFFQDNSLHHVPTNPVTVGDVTGAGDAAAAAIAVSYMFSRDPKSILNIANAVAAEFVRTQRTEYPGNDVLDRFIRSIDEL